MNSNDYKDLYRGLTLKADEIEEYKESIGNYNVHLKGFTSTTTKIKAAIPFALFNVSE